MTIMTCQYCKHTKAYEKCKYCSTKKSISPCGEISCKFCNKNTLESVPQIHKKWSSKNICKPKDIWKTSQKKVWIQCTTCEREFEQRADTIPKKVTQNGCSVCNHKCESIVYSFLKSTYSAENVKPQVKFEWSKAFSFDFCVFNKNETILVEVDGPQHFVPVKSWKSGFRTMHSDLEKEELALEHGCSVIRILQKNVFIETNESAEPNSQSEWKSFLQHNINCLSQDNKISKIITQQCPEYMTGIYKRLRGESFF